MWNFWQCCSFFLNINHLNQKKLHVLATGEFIESELIRFDCSWDYLEQGFSFWESQAQTQNKTSFRKVPISVGQWLDYHWLTTGLPVNHGHVFLVLWIVTCPVHANVQVYTGKVTFQRYQKNTAMFNWLTHLNLEYASAYTGLDWETLFCKL